jgi:hypothetical protein
VNPTQPPRGRIAPPLRPAAAAGGALLVVGAVALLAGRIAWSGNPGSLEDLLVGIGLVLLVAALGATVWLDRFPPSPATPVANPTNTEVAPEVTNPGAPARVAGPGSSIPAAYIAALYPPSAPEVGSYADFPEPIAAALPFAAMPRPAPRDGIPANAEDAGLSLDVELARLRARVQELETDRDGGSVAPWYAARSGASWSVAPMLATGGTSTRGLSVGGSACAGCGTSVPAQAPDSLCGGCGRPLCASCGGPPGPSEGLRRCPECRASESRNGAVSISGGRAASGSPETSVASDLRGAH